MNTLCAKMTDGLMIVIQRDYNIRANTMGGQGSEANNWVNVACTGTAKV